MGAVHPDLPRSPLAQMLVAWCTAAVLLLDRIAAIAASVSICHCLETWPLSRAFPVGEPSTLAVTKSLSLLYKVTPLWVSGRRKSKLSGPDNVTQCSVFLSYTLLLTYDSETTEVQKIPVLEGSSRYPTGCFSHQEGEIYSRQPGNTAAIVGASWDAFCNCLLQPESCLHLPPLCCRQTLHV